MLICARLRPSNTLEIRTRRAQRCAGLEVKAGKRLATLARATAQSDPSTRQRGRARIRAAALGCATALSTFYAAPVPGHGQNAAAELRAKQQKLEAVESLAKGLKADLAEIDAERARLNVQLQDTAKRVQRSEGQLTVIEARREELDSQQKLLQGSLAVRHDQISKLLSAMQRMGRNPPPVIITKREDALQMVRSAMMLARAFPELRSQANELSGRLTELARVMGEIKSEREKLEAETSRLKDAQLRLAGLMETKRQSLSERKEQLDEVSKAAAEIARNVTDLSDLIAKLDRTISERTSMGDYEKKMAAQSQQPTQQGELAPPATATTATAAKALPNALESRAGEPKPVVVAALPKLENPTFEIAPQGGPMAANPSRMMPATPFHLARGQLPLPAQGRRVIPFNGRMQSGAVSKGIVMETRQGAQITAPCDGWVLYASEFRSLGQLLIINAGSGYHVVLAGLSQIDVQLGQFVLAGEPVGTMSSAPKGKVQDNAAPVLYVEFRKEGRPVDPEPWWADSSKKVQG
jgi:murein hydrolase activator